MSDKSFLQWPFFNDSNRQLATELEQWCQKHLAAEHHDDVDASCRQLVKQLGAGGWLRNSVPAPWGGNSERLQVRDLCLSREILGRHSGLADFAFAMQGLGSGPISLFGSDTLRQHYLTDVAAGNKIAAFALSEPNAGSDVAAMATSARRDGDEFVLNGSKTWISNGGIADFYTVFARTSDEGGSKGISCFVVDADTPGLTIAERIEVIAPHPLATLAFNDCRVPAANLVGELGSGFKYAMGTLDVFRSTVGAAALGFARRALDEAVSYAQQREMFGATLADLQLTQADLGGMALEIDASALLIYRAAWSKDSGAARITREAAMAKLYATEAAQRVIDKAVQLHGGRGVVSGNMVESLYREVRALRIYEGASEVQRVIIGSLQLQQ
ncbi:acyl-CoA dehydrogenase [Gammaproteobacteria bacterium LSUCC0057]|uniref:Cyclohexane-1-carbonyl-CoA dehydrogenase n=1 Tax=Gammaproteobacteria bacterium LSUCC0057 TaxID=2559237 RepID=A0A4Y8UMR0_9GAMM|nr:acyl-CoA dehydrogenase [Gammaproteobacteria bacterium LSUCC0057]